MQTTATIPYLTGNTVSREWRSLKRWLNDVNTGNIPVGIKVIGWNGLIILNSMLWFIPWHKVYIPKLHEFIGVGLGDWIMGITGLWSEEAS